MLARKIRHRSVKLEGMLDNPVYHTRPSLGSNPIAKSRGSENGLAKQAYTDLYKPSQEVKLDGAICQGMCNRVL